jgi:hypothetical protein
MIENFTHRTNMRHPPPAPHRSGKARPRQPHPRPSPAIISRSSAARYNVSSRLPRGANKQEKQHDNQ